MHRHFVKAERFKIIVGKVEYLSAGSFVNAAALHTDKPVFDYVKKSDAVFTADLVELQNYILRRHCISVQ